MKKRFYKIILYLNQPLVRSLAYLLVPVLCLYAFGLPLAADYYYARAQQSPGPDTERQAYMGLQRAIKLTPDNDTYHRVYAQTSLDLARSFNQTGSAADKDKIKALVVQAVREAKLAVALNGGDWENASVAGLIFQTVAPVIPSGAEESLPNGSLSSNKSRDASTSLSMTALAEKYLELAVTLDPFNPVRRLDLGGFYFNERNTEKALVGALKAVELKPDFANAHYSLAAVYKTTGDTVKLKLELAETFKFLPPDSPYRVGIEQELKSLEASPKK